MALAAGLWNVGARWRRCAGACVPRDDTVSFPRLVGGAARVVADAVGSPPTWPASWIFACAARSRRRASTISLVGRYLFYRQNNLGGRIDVGAAGDEGMLGEGWGPRSARERRAAAAPSAAARACSRRLDVPEDLDVRVARGARPRRHRGAREL